MVIYVVIDKLAVQLQDVHIVNCRTENSKSVMNVHLLYSCRGKKTETDDKQIKHANVCKANNNINGHSYMMK